ncbi:hypothetical protein R1sor_012903 [Riccia sorocarpa]|uniref:Uncharacterized protein n=1 Tax=Riccia sorocarpa TaxID=122646 RepID=A0ABD3I7V4_9MARC
MTTASQTGIRIMREEFSKSPEIRCGLGGFLRMGDVINDGEDIYKRRFMDAFHTGEPMLGPSLVPSGS